MTIEQIKDWVLSKIGGIVQYGSVTAASSNGADAGEGRVSGTQLYTRRMGPWGLRSVPPVGSEWVGVAVGGSSANLIQVAAESTKRTANGLEYAYGPTDMAEGEVCLYAKSGQVVRLHENGDVTVVPKPGQKVKLGDDADANLDPVVLVTELRRQFNDFVNKYNGHVHVAGALLDGSGMPCTGSTAMTGNQALGLTTAVGSSNVVAKK